MQNNYLDAIVDGFKLRDEIENVIAMLTKIHTASVDVSCSDDTLVISSDWRNMEAKVEIKKDEIMQRVLNNNINPEDAICTLLKEQTCLLAHTYK